MNSEGMLMNETRFLGLLEKLIGETKHLQNNPAQGLIPKEDLVVAHVLECLKPFMKENGGVLEVEQVSYVENRSNLIIKYPGTTDRVCSFVGSHMDVVPADPALWERDPFKLFVEGDLLFGRGTTDCLGHVAALTDFFANLATVKPVLKHSIIAVFICNEENSSFPGIGVDQLAVDNYMDELKNGPLFWIDAADGEPCQGTAGNTQWQMEVHGKLFHSGLPHKGINSIEMAMDVVNYVQARFYADYPQHEKEIEYKYITSSTFKPTQISCANGSLNQINALCTVQGDIRLTPFYDIKEVMGKIESYIADINTNPDVVIAPHAPHGPFSKYDLTPKGENRKGEVKLKWFSEGENGVACSLSSKGFQALCNATREVTGDVSPYAINGSLPLIRELQEKGFDVQIAGYGFSSHYHADNERVSLSGMKTAAQIFSKIVELLEKEE